MFRVLQKQHPEIPIFDHGFDHLQKRNITVLHFFLLEVINSSKSNISYNFTSRCVRKYFGKAEMVASWL